MSAEQQSPCQKAAYFSKAINKEKSRVCYWKENLFALGLDRWNHFTVNAQVTTAVDLISSVIS